MTQQYQVTITMQPATVTDLINSGNVLYVFRAVQASDPAGRPLVWMSAPYSVMTQINCSDRYDAYTSPTPFQAGEQVTAGFSDAIEVGQQLQVQAGGFGEVEAGHVGAVSVLNTTGTYFTCGIGGGGGSGAAPFCAFPLYGNSLQVVVPLGKILLMFSSQPVAPGTVIDDFYAPAVRSFSSGVLIDLAVENQPALGYDINAGWSWGGFNWAQQVPAGTGLVPLLIEQPQPDSK
ncbi:MAG TPA: hypothetical protein VGA04_30545 [Streptosporangiaceae bacterium]